MSSGILRARLQTLKPRNVVKDSTVAAKRKTRVTSVLERRKRVTSVVERMRVKMRWWAFVGERFGYQRQKSRRGARMRVPVKTREVPLHEDGRKLTSLQ